MKFSTVLIAAFSSIALAAPVDQPKEQAIAAADIDFVCTACITACGINGDNVTNCINVCKTIGACK